MRVHALGVYRMNGTSKKSGNAYDMAKLVIQVPVEVVANQNMKRVGYGYGSKELDLEAEAINSSLSSSSPVTWTLKSVPASPLSVLRPSLPVPRLH